MPVIATLCERLRVELRVSHTDAYREFRYAIFGTTHRLYNSGSPCIVEATACIDGGDAYTQVAWHAVEIIKVIRCGQWNARNSPGYDSPLQRALEEGPLCLS